MIFELSQYSSRRNVLYAFVSDGDVKYVGKTTQPLYVRMSGYKKPGQGQITNIRNNARIKELLRSNAAVQILVLPDHGLLHFGQFHLNLAAGLEDSLIKVIRPEWNGSSGTVPTESTGGDAITAGNQQLSSTSSSDHEESDAPLDDPPSDAASTQPEPRVASFPVVVHKTYFNQGFFNVGVDYSTLLGADGQKIEILCGDDSQPVIGTINRTANINHTPRIMGGTGLRNWFQRNVRVMQEVQIIVRSPTSIRIQAGEFQFK